MTRGRTQIVRVLSGGQTGADIGGWRAAQASGLPCGGWMPCGYMTEDGARPEYEALYGAIELPPSEYGDWPIDRQYAERRRFNVLGCSCVLLFGDDTTPGARGLLADMKAVGSRPLLRIRDGSTKLTDVVTWLRGQPDDPVLLIAGNRESRAPGMGARVEAFLTALFRRVSGTEK